MQSIPYNQIPDRDDTMQIGRDVFESLMDDLQADEATFMVGSAQVKVKESTVKVAIGIDKFIMTIGDKLYHSDCPQRWQVPILYGIGLGVKAFLSTVRSTANPLSV